MRDWDDLRYLLAVSKHGSASAAAKALGVNHATVSRRISELETKLQTHLVDRDSLAWRITPAGRQIAEKAGIMEEAANSAARLAEAHTSNLSGTVRITTGETGFKFLVLDALKEVRRLLPDIRFELIADDDVVDLASRTADIAVRFTKSPNPNLFGQRICPVGVGLYGTRDIVSRYRQHMLSNPGKRSDVPLILFGETGDALPNWAQPYFAQSVPTDRVASINLLHETALAGFGLAALPHMFAHNTPQLELIPSVKIPSSYDAWVLAHADTQNSARIRAVKSILIEQLNLSAPHIEHGPATKPDKNIRKTRGD